MTSYRSVVNMASKLIVGFVFCALFVGFSSAWIPRLIHGRPKGGMLGAPANTHHLTPPPEQYFEFQRLDHFDGSNVQTWKQRYFVNDKYYQPGGPIFVMIGGEGPASPVWMVEGSWIEYTKQYNAICVQLEHRYYGKSHPVEDLSLKNLRYLNSRQALADLAYFIDSFRLEKNLTSNKLITFGGSYPEILYQTETRFYMFDADNSRNH